MAFGEAWVGGREGILCELGGGCFELFDVEGGVLCGDCAGVCVGGDEGDCYQGLICHIQLRVCFLIDSGGCITPPQFLLYALAVYGVYSLDEARRRGEFYIIKFFIRL